MSNHDSGPPRRRVLSDDDVARSTRRKPRRHKPDRAQERYEEYWQRMLGRQMAAYAVVLVLWVLPIPNPVKLLAVSFHEVSHGLAAVLTGGRVFGYAIAPNGAGITLGVGGVYPVILAAGYIGSCLWGVLLYYLTVRWRPNQCLTLLMVLMTGSAAFGWLNDYTATFGTGSLILLLGLFWAPSSAKVFVVRLIGSACCLYAPLEVAAKILGLGGAIEVQGDPTPNDVDQLAAYVGVPSAVVAVLVLAIQSFILVWIVRWTCKAGALRVIQQERAFVRWRRRMLREIRPEKQIHKIG